MNEYDGNVGDYSQTVTFKNKGDFYISPTGLSSRLAPFALMLVCGTVLTALAVGAMATYIALDFEGAFIAMHRLLFTNDLWLLDPRTDLLICLMPEEMFISLAVRLGLYVIPAWAAAAGCLGWAVCHERIQRFTGDRPGS